MIGYKIPSRLVVADSDADDRLFWSDSFLHAFVDDELGSFHGVHTKNPSAPQI